MDPLDYLQSLTPGPPGWLPDWKGIEDSPFGTDVARMADIPQNPLYHGEGDVWTHTKLVLEHLCGMAAYRSLPPEDRRILFLAALLHDIGKIPTTRLEDGQWTSPSHTIHGASMARELLWLDFDLAGTPERQALRETVCALIRRHGLPQHLLDSTRPEQKLRTAAEFGRVLPSYSLEKLFLLCEADAMGRICSSRDSMLENVQLAIELAQESDCLTAPYPFPSGKTRALYLVGKDVSPEVPLFEDSWGPVYLLAGLPGTGKDTWSRAHLPDLPMVSLDEIRAELGAEPGDMEGQVAHLARERAQIYLRQHQPFYWNATDLTPNTRGKLIQRFRDYGAKVHILYLETPLQENLRRNENRAQAVPEDVWYRMLRQLTPPYPEEADAVQWLCI